MGKEDYNKPILLVFIIWICYIQRGAGVATFPTASTSCTSSTANIDFNISLNTGETVILTRTFYFGSVIIAESDGTTLTPVVSYLPRLTAYGTYGISLSNVTVADAGNYTYVGTSSTTGNPFAATSTLSIQVAPTTGCSPHADQSGNKVKCTMDTASGKCGTAPIYTDWLNETGISNIFECDKEKRYRCCGVADSQSICSWNTNEFCIMYTCNASDTPPPGSGTTPPVDNNTDKIIGGTLGGVGGAAVVGAAVGVYLYKRKKSNGKHTDREDNEAQNDGEKNAKSEKGESEPKEPPAIHIRTQNRVESEPTNKKTSDRPQPLPPVGVVTEDRSKHRPQPLPPDNSDVKDPSKRGISANFDDKQGLPTGTPRPNKLAPLTQKQAHVEEEDASEEKPKKKRKNKRKKGQINEETQAEEMEELTSKRTLPEIPVDQSDGN